MALPKPPKDFYRLGEIAEEWRWTVDDILDYAEKEKIRLGANLRAPMAVTESINALAPLPQREEHYISGVYILTAESISYLRSPIKNPHMSFRVDPTKDEYPGVKFWYVTTESFQEYKEQLSLDSLVISEQEKTKIERKLGLAVGGDQEERQSVKQKKQKNLAEKLLAEKEEPDVIAARLKHECGATAWEIVNLLNISPHLDNNESRKREARRAIDRGGKKLAVKQNQNNGLLSI